VVSAGTSAVCTSPSTEQAAATIMVAATNNPDTCLNTGGADKTRRRVKMGKKSQS